MTTCLFNCSTNVVGGGAKNSAIFIKKIVDEDSISWCFALSPSVKKLLDEWGVEVPRATLFPTSPAKSLKARRSLVELSKKCGADIVYTMAGPSYVDFLVPHVQGISNPHITHPDFKDIRSVTPLLSLPSYFLRSTYQRRKAKNADYFIFQTQSSLDGFCNRTGVDRTRAIVIPNATDVSSFESSADETSRPPGAKIRILCPAAPYPHKGLEFIPYYAKSLVDLGLENFVFTLTISDDNKLYRSIASRAESLGVASEIDTIGPYSYSSAASVYASSDLVFVPSLLETFSATYLEAFASHKPLIAADRDFAKDICGEAAIYVDPHNPDDVAERIICLIESPDLAEHLINSGARRLSAFDTQESRINKICNFLLEVAGRDKYV